MSIKSVVVFTFIFCCAVGLAYLLHVNIKGDIYAKRIPSSESDIHLKGVKKDLLIYKHEHAVSHTEKLRAPVELMFLPVNTSADALKTNGVIELRLSALSNEDLSNVEIHWSLPEGVRLISGNIKELISLQESEPKEMALYVQIDDLQKNHQIHVYLSSKYSDIEFSTVALWESKAILEEPDHQNLEMQSLKKSVDIESDQPIFLE